MIENGIPESVADFIQGRASITVGSTYYLSKTNQADLFYSKVVPALLDILA
jgi:intergrase/recombinase